MKNISTKSIHSKAHKNDGLRICVMRRIHPEYTFHMWIPELAPSEKLLKQYVIKKEISWEEFSRQYMHTVLSKSLVKKIIGALAMISKSTKITLLCGEESAKNCHRSLIIKACTRLHTPES